MKRHVKRHAKRQWMLAAPTTVTSGHMPCLPELYACITDPGKPVIPADRLTAGVMHPSKLLSTLFPRIPHLSEVSSLTVRRNYMHCTVWPKTP